MRNSGFGKSMYPKFKVIMVTDVDAANRGSYREVDDESGRECLKVRLHVYCRIVLTCFSKANVSWPANAETKLP